MAINPTDRDTLYSKTRAALLADIEVTKQYIDRKFRRAADGTIDGEVKKVLYGQFVLPYEQIIRGMDFFHSIAENNAQALEAARQALVSGSLEGEFKNRAYTTDLHQKVLTIRTYLAGNTMWRIAAQKAEPIHRAEMTRRLLFGLQDVPQKLLVAWITKDKEKVIAQKLEGELGQEVVRGIQGL